MEKTIHALTGNEAAGDAMRQINPDVVAAYPITPQTEIVQIFSQFVADGLVDTEMVPVESEHSAMSATIGAAAGGARAMTATSSQGLALMWEMLYIASGLRLPIVMPVVNRSLSAPINIHCDHSDTMGARDSGWIQIYSEDAQEEYDNLIQAVRIAEHPEVQIPTMVGMDGFIISHGMQGVEMYPDEAVREFVGVRQPVYTLLDAENPITLGALDLYDYFFEHKRSQAEAMYKCQPYIEEVAREFEQTFGRKYGLFETYQLDDAELGIVILGSAAGTTRVAIDQLRAQGTKIGMLKLRVFRPFPAAELADSLKHLKVVAVLDRAEGMSSQGGPVLPEIKAALYDQAERPLMVNYVYGLGGRDLGLEQIASVSADLERIAQTGKVERPINHLGVRE